MTVVHLLADGEEIARRRALAKDRVLSAHGIAVAWITLDRFGQRASHAPASPLDPVFHLRRLGGGAGHVWRLFTTRQDAVDYLGEHYGPDSEALEWAGKLPDDTFDAMLARHTPRR